MKGLLTGAVLSLALTGCSSNPETPSTSATTKPTTVVTTSTPVTTTLSPVAASPSPMASGSAVALAWQPEDWVVADGSKVRVKSRQKFLENCFDLSVQKRQDP